MRPTREPSTIVPASDPSSALLEDVRAAASSGQTRYRDIRDRLDVDDEVLDRALMKLVKDGEVSLLAVGESVCVRR